MRHYPHPYPRRGISISRAQLEHWAGRPLTEAEVEQLQDAIPDAHVPEALTSILDAFTDEDDHDTHIGGGK